MTGVQTCALPICFPVTIILANGFSPQDTITPTQRALENYAAAEERRQLREQNIGWENVNNIQSALARGASIADQQSILEARAAATEAQKLANERERMAQRQLMLQEELAKKQIQQFEKQESNSPVQSQAVPAVLASSRTSENYGGGQEMPPALERYKTEIKKIISSAKKEIDIHIVKGNIDAARNFKIPVNTIVTEDLDMNTQIREFIQAEVEKFKHSSLQGFGH